MGHLRDRMAADLKLAGRSERTRDHYIRCARLFVKHFMRPPAELGEADVRQFMLHIVDDKKLSVGRQLQYLGAIKFLYGTTLRRPEVTAGIPWPRQARRDPVAPTSEEVVRLLGATTNPYWQVFFKTAYATGMRRREVANLRARDIDSTAGLIEVVNGKGGKQRRVRLEPDLLIALRDHWRRHDLPGPWVFPTRYRAACWQPRPISLDVATQTFRRAALKAELGHYRLHHLRNAFATHQLEQGLDLRTLQAVMGHARIDTTARYLKVRTDRIRTTPSLLDKLDL